MVVVCDELGSRFKSRHGWWAVDSNLGIGGGSLLAGGLELDVAVGFCLGGGGVFRCRQWARR